MQPNKPSFWVVEMDPPHSDRCELHLPSSPQSTTIICDVRRNIHFCFIVEAIDTEKKIISHNFRQGKSFIFHTTIVIKL